MNLFDKLCASVAFALGLVLVTLGVVVYFEEIPIEFTLTPAYAIPLLLAGWGILRPILIACRRRAAPPTQAALDALGCIDENLACFRCGYNLRSIHASGNCPECGTPVRRSAQWFTHLEDANPWRLTREQIELASPPIPDEVDGRS